ncbi:substrate-binding periplasmic protein [Pseudomonas sp. NA-150]|uniref:substrate-binding periplasmic protein n=1 Tax=Pseudomonas sp. NA-150 TaxID=3367525 RepID=UPI0037C86D1D
MPVILQFLTAALLTCLSFTAWAEKLRIVTEPWAPYVYMENGQPRGLDYDTTAIIFQRLGIDVEWHFLPWKRCLAMLEQGQADGALDIFKSPERENLLLYPSEPLSDVEWVLFYANARPHPIQYLNDLHGLTVGVSPGYVYGQDFESSPLFIREAAPSHEANFGKLLLGRVDLVVTDRRVGEYLLDQLKARDQVTQSPMVISKRPQYLAVRKKAGMDLLVQRFAAELKRFKREAAYAELVARYTGEVIAPEPQLPASPATAAPLAHKTVEQQESGAL